MTVVECPACETLNNTFVNRERCYKCGAEWRDHFAALPIDGP